MNILDRINFFLNEQEDDETNAEKQRRKREKERKKRQAEAVRGRIKTMRDRIENIRTTAARRDLPGFKIKE